MPHATWKLWIPIEKIPAAIELLGSSDAPLVDQLRHLRDVVEPGDRAYIEYRIYYAFAVGDGRGIQALLANGFIDRVETVDVPDRGEVNVMRVIEMLARLEVRGLRDG